MSDDQIHIVETKESSSGAGWLIPLMLLAVLAVGILFFSRTSESEAAKDNAVAKAAQSVGSAAKDVGSAAKDAAD